MITSLFLALQLIQPPQVCSGIIETLRSPADNKVVFQLILPADGGNTSSAKRDAEEWLKMDTETRLFWALLQIRDKDPVGFDDAMHRYGLKFHDELRPQVLPPVQGGS